MLSYVSPIFLKLNCISPRNLFERLTDSTLSLSTVVEAVADVEEGSPPNACHGKSNSISVALIRGVVETPTST